MSSFKDGVDQIMEDMKGRFRNPLILSFIFVWLYYHWPIIYTLLTINNAIPVNSRLSVFTAYVKQQTQWRMIWQPLIFSFISLAIFYLIGVAAQYIKLWLGKRLSAEMLAKYDKGKFEEKTVVEKIRADYKKVKGEKDTLETELETNKSKLRQRDAELEETQRKNNEKINEKDTEIGKLFANVTALSIERNELHGNLEKEKANNNLIRDQVNILMGKEIDANVELEVLRKEAEKFSYSQGVFEQLTVLDGKEIYGHLSLDEHTVMVIIFGNTKWDVIDTKNNTVETLVYERGFLTSPDRKDAYRISNVMFDSGILTFSKMAWVSPGMGMKEDIVKLQIDKKHELYGVEGEKKVKYIHSRLS